MILFAGSTGDQVQRSLHFRQFMSRQPKWPPPYIADGGRLRRMRVAAVSLRPRAPSEQYTNSLFSPISVQWRDLFTIVRPALAQGILFETRMTTMKVMTSVSAVARIKHVHLGNPLGSLLARLHYLDGLIMLCQICSIPLEQRAISSRTIFCQRTLMLVMPRHYIHNGCIDSYFQRFISWRVH